MDSYNTALVSDPSNVQLLKRIGRVVEIKPDDVNAYRAMLADENSGVRLAWKKYQLRNFSMFLSQHGNRWLVFAYCEYAGRDFHSDMAALDKDTGYREWQESCQKMYVSHDHDPAWTESELIFFNP